MSETKNVIAKSAQPLFLFYCLIFVAYAVLPGQLSTKNQSEEDSTSVFYVDGKHLIETGWSVATAPLHWQKSDFIKTGIYTGVTVLSMSLDKAIKKQTRANQSENLDKFFAVDEYYGSGKTLILSGGLYLSGFLFKEKELRRIGLLSFEAFVYSGIIANLIKPIIGRSRPNASDSNLDFHHFTLNDDYHAIPSGHTTVAFAFSTVMAKSVDNTWWDIFWYGLAVSTAGARVYHNRHWSSDVIAASFLGYSVGSFVMDRESRTIKKEQSFNFSITPDKISLTYIFN